MVFEKGHMVTISQNTMDRLWLICAYVYAAKQVSVTLTLMKQIFTIRGLSNK